MFGLLVWTLNYYSKLQHAIDSFPSPSVLFLHVASFHLPGIFRLDVMLCADTIWANLPIHVSKEVLSTFICHRSVWCGLPLFIMIFLFFALTLRKIIIRPWFDADTGNSSRDRPATKGDLQLRDMKHSVSSPLSVCAWHKIWDKLFN